MQDHDYQIISEEELYNKCCEESEVIIKPSIDSSGGKGIKFWNKQSDRKELIKSIGPNCIIQEVIKQHQVLSELHKESLNTVRIMVMFFDGKIRCLSSVLRMGVNSAKVDNASSGGIVCGINPDGRLKNFAVNTKAEIFNRHPQGATFQDYVIPGYQKAVDMVSRLALRFVSLSKLQSWDIAIGEDGEPIVIEVNLTFGQVDFQQMCNGPILGEDTEKILNYIYSSNRYRPYR